MKNYCIFFSLLFLFLKMEAQNQDKYKLTVIGYKYGEILNKGDLERAWNDIDSSLPALRNFSGFKGFSIGTIFINNRSYANTNFTLYSSTTNNEFDDLEPIKLAKNKLTISTWNLEFGVNATKKNIIISPGIGFGITSYRVKKWRYLKSSSVIFNNIQTLNYSFEKLKKQEDFWKLNLKVFLNILILNPENVGITIYFKPFVTYPVSESNFGNDIKKRLIFFGLELGIQLF